MKNQSLRRRQQGFTLTEVVVAAALVALLVGIAVPSYRTHTLRANRTVAKAAMLDIMSREEAWFVDRKTYTSVLTTTNGLGLNGAYLSRDGSTSAANTTTGIYSLSVGALGAVCPGTGTPGSTGYTITATPIASTGTATGQTADTVCGTLCLTSTNIRMVYAGVPAAQDNSATTLAQCWSK